MPLADGQLLVCVNPPISSIDETCFALLDADSGESSRLCALPAHKAYAGFALDGDSLYFTDGETIYCAAPPYDAVESVGYLPSLDTSVRLPALLVDNCYCVCNAELGFFAAQLHTAPRCTLRVDARLSNVNRALVSQYLRAHPDVAVVYAPHNASTAPEYRQHMESGDALDIYAFTLPNESFIPLRDKGDLLDLRPLMGADTLDSLLPQVLAPLEKAGGLFAIPCGAPSVSCWFLDQSSLESLGLTDVPATYADLMTLISTYLTDFASDSDVALADNPSGMADSLFQQLFWAQLARCEASGVLPTFTDADFVAALRQYIALRPALVDYENRWLAERSSSLGDLGDTGSIVTILSVSSSQPSLLHLNTSLTPSKTDEVPLLLSFGEGGAEDSGRRSALHAVPRHPVPLGEEAGRGYTGGRARCAPSDSAERIQRGGNRNVSCAPESRASAGIVVLGQRRPACIHPVAAPSGRRMHRGDVRAGIDPHCADDDA